MTTYLKFWNKTYIEVFKKYQSIIDVNSFLKSYHGFIYNKILDRTHDFVLFQCKKELELLEITKTLLPMNEEERPLLDSSLKDKSISEFELCKSKFKIPVLELGNKLQKRWSDVDSKFENCLSNCSKIISFDINDKNEKQYKCFKNCFVEAKWRSYKIQTDIGNYLPQIQDKVDKLYYDSI